MNINFTLLSSLQLCGLIQGLVLGIMLLFFHNSKNNSFFLGLHILTTGLNYSSEIIEQTNLLKLYPSLDMLPFDFLWLQASLLYAYTYKISVFRKVSFVWFWVLIPGIIFFIIDIVIFFQAPIIKMEIQESWWYFFLKIVAIPYTLFILFKLIILIKKHTKHIENEHSEVSSKNLLWIRNYAFLNLLIGLSIPFAWFYDFSDWYYYFLVVIDIVLLYFISLKGLLHYNFQPLIDLETSKDKEIDIVIDEFLASKENTSITVKEEENKLIEIILTNIREKELFVNPDMTIIDLSNEVKIHPKRISLLINTHLNKNFNSLINEFRIEKAKEMLIDQKYDNITIDSIGIAVGFKSKSTFYEAFKKYTKITPSNYKKNEFLKIERTN